VALFSEGQPVKDGDDFARNGRAPIDLQLKLMQQATSAMAASTQRVQADVDSILHAFAMIPVAAERAIRSAAAARDAAAAQPRAERRAPPRKPRREHAR
jgi:hypothetical protein